MSEEIRIYSGGAPRAALKPLAAEFERATGQRLAFTFDGVSAIHQRLAAGEKADLILLPTPMIDLFDLTLIWPPLAPFEIVPITMMMFGVALSARDFNSA